MLGRILKHIIQFGLLFSFFSFLFHSVVPVVKIENGVPRVMDFSYHIIVIRAFWFEGVDNIYSLANQVAALKTVFGDNITGAMPIGVSPVALFLWYPFAYIARHDLAAAQALWVSATGYLCFFVLWQYCKDARSKTGNSVHTKWLLLPVVFSFTAVSAAVLGQTSPYAISLLFLLHSGFSTDRERLNSGILAKSDFLTAILLLLLLLKPPYFLLGAGCCVIYRRFSAILLSLILVGILFIVSGMFQSSDWFSDYLWTLNLYTSGEIPAEYRSSIVPETMLVFSSVSLNLLGKQLALGLASLLFFGGYLAVLGSSFTSKFATNTLVNRPVAFSLLIAIYLLFFPYVGAYEDLLVTVILIIAGTVELIPNITPRSSYSILRSLFPAIAFLIVLNHLVLLPKTGGWLLFGWTVKFSLCFFFALWPISFRLNSSKQPMK